jgi:hypothetical protein
MHGTLCIALFASVQIRPPSAYRLIFSGKVLSDTAALLSTLGISDRRTVHLAEGNAFDAAVVPIGQSNLSGGCHFAYAVEDFVSSH